MIERIDHIAIAVKDHDGAERFFRDILGAVPGERFKAGDRNFYWQTLAFGDLSRLEIISPSGPDSFLDGFLATRVGGFHHITLQTRDLAAMIERLDAAGIPFFGRHEYPNGTWKEVFIHPRDAFGVLVQIAEFDAAYWMVPEAKLPEGQRWDVEQCDGAFKVTCAHPGGGKVVLDCTREEVLDLSSRIQQALQS